MQPANIGLLPFNKRCWPTDICSKCEKKVKKNTRWRYEQMDREKEILINQRSLHIHIGCLKERENVSV